MKMSHMHVIGVHSTVSTRENPSCFRPYKLAKIMYFQMKCISVDVDL